MDRSKRHMEHFDRIMESSYNQQEFLAKLLSYIFSDEFIFTDRPFRKLLELNPKGYIHINKLAQNQMLVKYFQHIRVQHPDIQENYIREAVQSSCPQLYYHLSRVRRVTPFNIAEFKKMKPICLERVTSPVTISDVRNYFGEHVFTPNKTFDIDIDEDILIYSPNYRNLLPSIQAQNPPFQILDFQAYYKQYDLSSRLRQRKHKSLSRPLEVPKRRFQDFERRQSRNNSDSDHQQYKRQSRQDIRKKQRADYQQFVKIGRQPNPSFNSLLKQLTQCYIQLEN